MLTRPGQRGFGNVKVHGKSDTRRFEHMRSGWQQHNNGRTAKPAEKRHCVEGFRQIHPSLTSIYDNCAHQRQN